MKPIRNSAKAIIIEDGRILLIRNLDQQGDWYLLPGGGQNHGESLIDALRRECQEEIGSEVTVGRLRLIREYIARNHEFAAEDGETHQVEFMFECRIDAAYTPANGKLPDAFQTGVVWIPLCELHHHRLYPKVLIPVFQNDLEGSETSYLGDVN